MPVSHSKVPQVLQQRDSILADWMAEQLAAGSLRADLLTEEELRKDCARFLEALASGLAGGMTSDLQSSQLEPVAKLAGDLARARGRQGFSPSEVATFILSLKSPLFTSLRKVHGADAAALGDDIWQATLLLDNLGLLTFETYQQVRDEIIRRQQEEMLELSTPVVRLWKGIVALPLIGTLDSARTSIVMESLLQTIVESSAEIAIIDITGVPTVDTLVAQHLLKTVAAARLMGADCIISGIRPQIAQTMVHLQIDLSNVITRATMAEALQVALKRTGFAVMEAVAAKSHATVAAE